MHDNRLIAKNHAANNGGICLTQAEPSMYKKHLSRKHRPCRRAYTILAHISVCELACRSYLTTSESARAPASPMGLEARSRVLSLLWPFRAAETADKPSGPKLLPPKSNSVSRSACFKACASCICQVDKCQSHGAACECETVLKTRTATARLRIRSGIWQALHQAFCPVHTCSQIMTASAATAPRHLHKVQAGSGHPADVVKLQLALKMPPSPKSLL